MLTIDGVTYDIQAPFSQLEPYRVGQEFRVYDGTLASQVRGEKRRYAATTALLTPAERETLLTNTALDDAITVSFVIDGVTTTMTARVRVTSELSVISLWTLRLDIEEV